MVLTRLPSVPCSPGRPLSPGTPGDPRSPCSPGPPACPGEPCQLNKRNSVTFEIWSTFILIHTEVSNSWIWLTWSIIGYYQLFNIYLCHHLQFYFFTCIFRYFRYLLTRHYLHFLPWDRVIQGSHSDRADPEGRGILGDQRHLHHPDNSHRWRNKYISPNSLRD